MNIKNFDPKNTNLKVNDKYNYYDFNAENNSFLFLSAHRNNYFYNIDKKLNCNSENYEGYLLNDLFFSDKNIEIIQRQIILSVFNRTSKKFVIPYQNPKSLEIVMKYIFNEYAQNLPYKNKEQIIELNNKVTDEIVTSIINKVIYREYHYNEINSDNKVNDLPINSSNRSDTLLSTTNRFK